MLSPFYTAAHVDAAVAVRADENTDANAQSVVVYANDTPDASHPRITTLSALPDADADKVFVGVTLESFARGQLGTVQIGGVANVKLELEDRDEPLSCGTLLYPNWLDGISASGVALTPTPAVDGLRAVARVHHHERHSNIAQARLLHGTQYTGISKITLPPIQEPFVETANSPIEVDFGGVANAAPRKRKRFGDSVDLSLAAVEKSRKPGQFSEFFD
ncbi:MAG: hypothetical protein CL678_00960 [Bdellovibrionaceae bacterium]|nr:hypothetical protein [Pseudobdellovibrionaceae bacterium]